MTPLDADRRSTLRAAKLRALVRDHLGDVVTHAAVEGAVGGAAALLSDGDAWVYVDATPVRGLGIALSWAARAGASDVHVVVDDPHDAAILARRAGEFQPSPVVWRVEGRSLVAVEPAAHLPAVVPSPATEEFALLLRSVGVEVVVEHGVVTGEVLGLEIARVVDDAQGCRLEVGVGRHDREAFVQLHGELPGPDALGGVVAAVRAQRRPGGGGHPLFELAAARWLRVALVASPSLVGAAVLEPIEGPMPHTSLAEAAPAAAIGSSETGAPLVVVTSVGIDVDLVPWAADARHRAASLGLVPPDAEIVLALPARDTYAITRELAARLAAPARVYAIADGWR